MVVLGAGVGGGGGGLASTMDSSCINFLFRPLKGSISRDKLIDYSEICNSKL